MSSCAEMSFLDPKKVKKSLNRVKTFFIMVDMAIKRLQMYADFKMGQLPFLACSYKKLETKIVPYKSRFFGSNF
jgi:hypothetical protein